MNFCYNLHVAAKSKLSIYGEYATLRLFCGVVNLIPYRAAMAIAAFFGWFAVSVLGLHRRRTLERIGTVFPGIGARDARRIAWRSFANILQTGVEMIRSPRLDRAWMDRHVVDGREYHRRLQALADEGHGVVVMVPHTGNWYMAAWSMARYGLPLVALAARQRNPAINAWMQRQYGDIEILERGSARTMVEIRRRLAAGRVFAILPDLRVPQLDVEAPFLGGVANVSHAGAMFAVAAGAPVVVAAMRRERGKHVFEHLATLRPDPAAADRRTEAVRLTREAMALIDGFLHRHPEQWFWFNKRWILQPVNKKGN